MCEVDPEEKLKVNERLVMGVNKLGQPPGKDVQQLKEVCVEVSVGSLNIWGKGEAYDCIVVPVMVPLVSHAEFKGLSRTLNSRADIPLPRGGPCVCARVNNWLTVGTLLVVR